MAVASVAPPTPIRPLVASRMRTSSPIASSPLTIVVLWSAFVRVFDTSTFGMSVQMCANSRMTSGCDASSRASGQNGLIIS